MKYTFLSVLLLALVGANGQNTGTIHSFGKLSTADADSFCYAVIGDYGDDSRGEKLVADMVKSWDPLFIITTGDNDYEDKNEKSIDTNISKYYASYISPDLHRNRFFPSLGNHDQSVSEKAKVVNEYFRIFSCLNKAENYDFTWGPVHFYSINSGPGHISGNIGPSVLKDLKSSLDRAPEPFHLVFFHHPQYSSAFGAEGPIPDHLAGYGIDAVLNGHIHYYERMSDTVRHIEYITIGCSGRNNDKCGTKLTGNNEIVLDHCEGNQNGAVKVTVVKVKRLNNYVQWRMTFEYYNVAMPHTALDTWTLVK